MNRNNILTVTQINEFVRMLLDENPIFRRVTVMGEISNFTNHSSGHLYFTLKDDTSQLKAVMYRSNAVNLPFVPENGMKVIVSGRITAYVKGGVYQLCADMIQPDGIGMLYFAFEQLKNKLRNEGLFDESRKKPLPKNPSRIGIVTSPTGAAVHDIINIIGRRSPSVELVLYPVQVQGAGAAAQICEGVEYFSSHGNVDLVIVGRGGGSAEDLWAFNDEKLARTVAACPIPVISAVGHETDFTICDFVADMRAPTPSGAAEIAVPDSMATRSALMSLNEKILMLTRNRLAMMSQSLQRLESSPVMSSPQNAVDEYRFRLSDSENRLFDAFGALVGDKKHTLSVIASKMNALNPMSVLSRGFAYVTHNGAGVSSAGDLKSGDTVRIKFADGSAEAQIVEDSYGKSNR